MAFFMGCRRKAQLNFELRFGLPWRYLVFQLQSDVTVAVAQALTRGWHRIRLSLSSAIVSTRHHGSRSTRKPVFYFAQGAVCELALVLS